MQISCISLLTVSVMLVKTGANNKPRLSPLRCPVRCHKTEAGTVGDERRSKYVDQS